MHKEKYLSEKSYTIKLITRFFIRKKKKNYKLQIYINILYKNRIKMNLKRKKERNWNWMYYYPKKILGVRKKNWKTD